MMPNSSLPYRRIECVDCHCCGEPARIVIAGVRDPTEPGTTVYDKKKYFESNDGLRKLLLQEPRGYPCQNADLIVAPKDQKKASFGYIIMQQGEYPPVSGHNTICTATALLETGLVPIQVPITRFNLEAPAGIIEIEACCSERKAESITFTNVPAFVVHDNAEVKVPNIGTVLVSVVFSGIWFAIVDDVDTKHGIAIEPQNGKKLCGFGECVKQAAREQLPVVHPENPEIHSVCLIVLRSSSRNKATVVMSNGKFSWEEPETWTGMLDRSPCGTGTSAVMTLEHSRGLLRLGEAFTHSGILGTSFEGILKSETKIGTFTAVIPRITGRAWITGYNTLVVDPSDPLGAGFTVGDIWSS